MKQKNPYQRLLDEIMEWCQKVIYRHEVTMWVYPKNRLVEGWELHTLYERTKAAEQLGYDVILVATDEGLRVSYKKQIPFIPIEWR